MIKKILTILIIVGALIGFYFLTSKKTDSDNQISTSDLILFYGSTCPHCKVVEEFISEHQIDQKLKINKIEVYENKSNSSLFIETVNKICSDQLSSEGLPVPFLVDQENNKCFIGDNPIIDYLSEKSK